VSCPVCKGEEYCKPKNYELCTSRYYSWLTFDDWKEIYYFMRTVYLPTIHGILARAEKRQKNGN